MGPIDELSRAPLALGALWLLTLAWLLNNPEPVAARPVKSAAPASDRCSFCGVDYSAEGPLCWCALAECWR
jgi:hypothetical protein